MESGKNLQFYKAYFFKSWMKALMLKMIYVKVKMENRKLSL